MKQRITLKKRVIRKSDSRHDMGSAKRDLLDLGEKFIHDPIKAEFSYVLNRNEFLRPNFRGVKNTRRCEAFNNVLCGGSKERSSLEFEVVFVFLRYDLDTELPFGICPAENRFFQILAMKVYAMKTN
jgi:hypothetical protein